MWGEIMEVIIWSGVAGVLGLALGVLGYFHSKLAYSVFITALGAVTFLSHQIVGLTGGDIAGAAAMGTEDGGIVAVGILKNLFAAIETMGLFPKHVQIAILVFALSFFLARILTWARTSFGKPPAEESAANRRARVLRAYGMNSMDDVRSLR